MGKSVQYQQGFEKWIQSQQWGCYDEIDEGKYNPLL
jgi:hypothetical protein